MLIQLAICTDDIVLLGFDLREDLLYGGLSLPVPVEPRHAAGKQLTGLLKLRFCAFTLPIPASNRARFCPTNPDPSPQ